MSRFFCNDLPMLSHHYAFSDVSLINYKPKYSFCQIMLQIKMYCSVFTYIKDKKNGEIIFSPIILHPNNTLPDGSPMS